VIIKVRTFYAWKAKVQSESSAMDFITKFAKIGFIQNHQRLMTDIKRVYNDSLRRYFFEVNKGNTANRYTIMKLEQSYRENAKLLYTFSMGSPIIAQIKAKIEAMNKLELPDKDVTKLEQDNQNIGVESRSGNGLSGFYDYSRYNKFISRTGEENEPLQDKPDVTEPELQDEAEGMENGEDESFGGATEKRVRTRHNELIEGGAETTDRVF
jgi:hypothetical protein